jgi:hypothetical protein
MTREKGVSECYQSIGLTCPTFPPNFYFFLGPPGPLNSKKRSLLQSSYMESCLASHSVADPGCLSRILIFTHHKFHTIENYFIFEKLKKKSWANFQRIIELYPKNCH